MKLLAFELKHSNKQARMPVLRGELFMNKHHTSDKEIKHGNLRSEAALHFDKVKLFY